MAGAVLLSLAQQSAADEAPIANSVTDEAAARASFDQAMQRLGSGDAAQATTELIAERLTLAGYSPTNATPEPPWPSVPLSSWRSRCRSPTGPWGCTGAW